VNRLFGKPHRQNEDMLFLSGLVFADLRGYLTGTRSPSEVDHRLAVATAKPSVTVGSVL
jgi:hypothetical protein